MYKHLFFLDSKTLDRLTPYILVLASDTIAFNVFVLTFVSAVVFNFLNSMLALMAIFIGAGYVVGFWLYKLEGFLQSFSIGDYHDWILKQRAN
ncbi:immunity protein BlpZ [Streptococcus pneumoniae]|uniref:immunity protein BlpZ n=1 Tax=Streptococcus pneumoniae TaxID=1313 RepID=UPI00061BD512|nr:immunity protein BlpZ [Streptococcus pneumoniae]CKI86944.1 immunity protein BlpZ [Streptococcus pneumoniae]